MKKLAVLTIALVGLVGVPPMPGGFDAPAELSGALNTESGECGSVSDLPFAIGVAHAWPWRPPCDCNCRNHDQECTVCSSGSFQFCRDTIYQGACECKTGSNGRFWCSTTGTCIAYT